VANDRVALVTGANKGIGLEVARQLAAAGVPVVIGARDARAGEAAADSLRAEGREARSVVLDVTDAAAIAGAAAFIEAECGRLDILVNNAGIASMEDGMPGVVDMRTVRRTFETNFFGALAVTQAMLPLLRRSPFGCIINQSSDLGSLTHQGDPGWKYAQIKPLGYAASKAALNMMTVQLAAELRAAGIKVFSANPRSTATDLNGHRGQQSIPEGAAIATRLALMPGNALTGAFLNSAGPEPW